MPKINISASGTATIPGNPRRKGLAFQLTGGTDAFWGFESTVAHTGSNAGLPMPSIASGQFITLSEAHLASVPIRLASAAGGEITYTELK